MTIQNFFCQLDAYERTLSMLLNRIEQMYHGVPLLHDLTRGLRTLLSHTSNMRSHYERNIFLVPFELKFRQFNFDDFLFERQFLISETTCFMMNSLEVDVKRQFEV